MLISDYILSRLGEEGIDTAFLVYGGAISELVDAFPRQDKIKYVVMQHEQSCGFSAEGYAKVKGIGLAIATSGPGGQNLVTAIANCYYDSVPVLFITGQVNSKFLRPSDDIRQVGFQESPISDIVKPITKWSKIILHAGSLKGDLEHAISVCKSGRKGPVLLDIPSNVMKAHV